MILTLFTLAQHLQFHCSMMPVDWVAMVADDDIIFNRDGKSKRCSLFLLCAGADVTGGGQREVTSSTGHCHITEVTTGRDRLHSQGRGCYLLYKHTHTHTHIHRQCLRDTYSTHSKHLTEMLS